MALKVAQRGNIPPFIVMDVMRAANAREREKGDVIHMEVGQPGTGAPAGVIAAARRALTSDRLGYTDAFGIPELRTGIAAHYRSFYGVDVPEERIAVTTGSSGSFMLSFLAAFDVGDRVALVEPGYAAYKNILAALGIETVRIESGVGDRFQPTVERLREAGALDGLIIASPSNPTGTMLSPSKLAEIANYCRETGIRLVSDEIYHGITYGMDAATAAATDENAIVINSFSKYFSMTGWRLGWMIVPPDMLRAVECLAQNLFISPPTLSQHAAVAAFDCHEELEENVVRYAANRDLLLDALPGIGFDRLAPSDGAFYLYADIAHLTNDSAQFCSRLLDETGIATTPGIDFDPRDGATQMRLSFSGPTADMEEAVRRLRTWRR